MKKYLIVACAAATLVGCANNRGGMSDRTTRETGTESYDRSSTNNWNSTTTTNSSSPSTGKSSEDSGSQNNGTPKN